MALWAADCTLIMTTLDTLSSQAIASFRVTRWHRLCLGTHCGEAHDIWAEDTVLSTKVSCGSSDDALDLQIRIHAIWATMTFSRLNGKSSRALQILAFHIRTRIFWQCKARRECLLLLEHDKHLRLHIPVQCNNPITTSQVALFRSCRGPESSTSNDRHGKEEERNEAGHFY